jgi:acyl-CoA synthetase (AMP-forming)/AMP-acid ligase II
MGPWNLADLFEAVADEIGGREAVVAPGRRWTFSELDERANRLAHVMVYRGVRPGDRVALSMRNGPEYLEAMLAALKLRAVPVNVNVRYTVEELQYLLADAGPRLVLHEPDLTARVTAAAAGLPHRPGLLARGRAYEALLAGAPADRPVISGRSGDDLYVLYTGGTTGQPKGVVWRHEDIFFSALATADADGRRPGSPEAVVAAARTGRTRCLPASPFTHGTAHWTALAALFNGGTVVVAEDGAGLAPQALWSTVEAERVSMLVIVGDAFARPLADALDLEPDRWDLSHLLLLLSGGAVLSPAVRQALLAHLGWAVVVDGYGTSETGGQGRMAIWPGQVDSGMPHFTVDEGTAVLDDQLRLVEPGSRVVGRLARRGHIPVGYHNDPERTAATFPTVDGVRWAVTGDRATVDPDGRIKLLGRGSSSINTGGEKVFPEEVEATLKAHPTVFDAVVVGVPDERWGERVTAVVQPRNGSTVTLEDLSEHCRQTLAGYKTPRQLVIVDVVVRHPTGKADHRWARRVALDPPRLTGHAR